MATNPFLKQLSDFFRAARHLWGRCPYCGDLFRLSDVAIQYGSEPPRDWLRRLQKQQDQVRTRQFDLEQQQGELEALLQDLQRREDDIDHRERRLEQVVRDRVRDAVKGKEEIKGLLKSARQEAAHQSRSTLLGHFFERLAPFLQEFKHDPRDVRTLMNPIDYVCFDGLTRSREVEKIVFIEVKSGTSRTTPVQKSIIEAVNRHRVSTEVWHFGDRGIPISQQLLGARGGLPIGK
jgi:predicted Holliday junction resolvase-like endonuclease